MKHAAPLVFAVRPRLAVFSPHLYSYFKVLTSPALFLTSTVTAPTACCGVVAVMTLLSALKVGEAAEGVPPKRT